MNRIKLFSAVLLASTALGHNLSAAEVKLDPVVVSVDQEAGYSTDALDLGISYPSTPFSDGGDYLRSLPGVSFSRFGGHGLEPVIRGQSKNQLNVVADDSYIFGGCPNRMDPPSSYMNIDSAEDITVVRGYQSVLNGFGGSGGSIIIQHKKPEIGDKFSITGTAQAGYDANSDMFYTGADITGGGAGAYARASASFKDAGNYEDGNGRQVRSAFEERSGGATFGLTSPDSHIYVGYDRHKIEDALFAGSTMDSPLSDGQTLRAAIDKDVDGKLLRKISMSAYSSLANHEMDNYTLRSNTGMKMRVDSDSDTYGAKIAADLNAASQVVKTSLDFRSNNRNANRYSGMMVTNVSTLQSLLWPDITTDEVALSAETTFKFNSSNRVVTGGRYDYVNVDYGKANIAATATGLSSNDLYNQFYGRRASSETENNFGGLMRYEHDFNHGLTAYTGISRMVRTADSTERGIASYSMSAGNNLSWVGNPGLNPEQHHQIDAGLKARDKDWQFGASAYVDKVTDYILRDSARGQAGILVNATTATIYRNIDALLSGFELEGSINLPHGLRLRGDATYTYGENTDDNMPLAQIPPLQGKVELGWQALEYLDIGSRMRWAMTQTKVDTSTATGSGLDVGKTSGYAVFDLNATVTKLNPLSLTFGVNNLFDKVYANHLNRSNAFDATQVQVNEPGRAFYVQARLPF